MISALLLPGPLRAHLIKEARGAFPRECCGLIEGMVSGAHARATALHATRNLAVEPDRFEIDPAVQFALLRRFRGAERGIVGCYHSHPNGRPAPSARDCVAAVEENFLWLIAAFDEMTYDTATVTAFVSTGQAFSPVRIESPSLDRFEAPPL
ncbi:MAG TPA: M67 family metallopeptidase [Rhizomicrobium sp.]|nr:M67 family metallopeptidase [Rhizomicrobium sp.]